MNPASLYFTLLLSFFVSTAFFRESTALAQSAFPKNVEAVLATAGDNRTALEEMLHAYRQGGDSEKYEAACFLVANMGLHYTGGARGQLRCRYR